ncbi:hypothetical protein KEM48_001287 [Puccinia striiformis f. sp. tritici PST-130]|nr:hypothetical protein KEM48_001287 [Puccinia striiformis f. sp. tritici PST-130]
MGGFRRESGLTTDSQDQAPNESSKPPYPSSFHELAKLISSTSNENNPNDLLLSLLSQNNPNLHGLRTIPNKLNDYKPSSPVLANQIGAGKKLGNLLLILIKPEDNLHKFIRSPCSSSVEF